MIKFEKIKNIIFDLGGVLINISPQKTIEAFNKVAKKEHITTLDKFMTNFSILQDLEMGLISEKDFFAKFNGFLEESLSKKEILHIWNAMLLDFPAYKIEMVKKLKSRKIWNGVNGP